MKRKLMMALSVLLLSVLPAQAANLTLPADLTGTINQQVSAPLNIDDAAGIIGIELDIEYNPDILSTTIADVTLTSLTNKPNNIFFANVSSPGSIGIVYAVPTALSGSGALFNIGFKIVGAGVDSPQIVRCALFGEDAGGNEIEIPCNEAQAGGDHFLCYTTKPARGATNRFAPLTNLTLTDQFETRIFDVPKAETLCNPAEKTLPGGSPEEINDPNTHLRGYQIKLTRTDPVRQEKHEKQSDVKVTNQLGTIFVETLVADRLLVPTAKSLIGPIASPNPTSHDVDHFKCYTVRVESRICQNDPSIRCRGNADCASVGGVCNLGFPKDLIATLEDQFDEPTVYDIQKPAHLCTPVDKAGEGMKDPEAHLLCYQVKPMKGLCAVGSPSNAGGVCQREQDCGGTIRPTRTSFCVFQEKHDSPDIIHTNNQFGPEQLNTIKPDQLCVPSQKTLLDR